MNRLLLSLLLAGALAAPAYSQSKATAPAARPVVQASDVTAVPNNVTTAARDSGTIFQGKDRGDEGLKKLQIPDANPFVGIKLVVWGLSIAGVLLGGFIAVVIVLIALKILKNIAAPGVFGGAPIASGVLLNTLDAAVGHARNRRKLIAKELVQLDKRLGKSRTDAKKPSTKVKKGV